MSLGLLLSSSNCVINLAPDKKAVLWEAYRVLKVMPRPVPVWRALLLGCPWDAANGTWPDGDAGWGQGRGPSWRVLQQKGSFEGCLVLSAPFVQLLLGVSLHSLLPSSPGERCTSVMSMPAST